MAYHAELGDRVRRFLTDSGVRLEEKRMMGGLCFMVDGKMCAGVETDRLMVRIDPERYEAALRRKGCTPMDFTGRPMRGFVFVSRDVLTSAAELKFWLNLALEFNPRALSSKQRAAVTRKKAASATRFQRTARVSPR